jgi:tRNA-dihydrouridine synthase A
LAQAAKLGQAWGYEEINLNCGCPSERVQRGAFGACLMREPGLVADCFKAMADAVSIPITVKHRLGLGRDQDLGMLTDFVGTLHHAGCKHFIVHARNAWLEGLSPKDNREVPPLRYQAVYDLAGQFPDSIFVLNGGLGDHRQALEAVKSLHGVMVGRAAYQRPALLADVDQIWFEAKLSSGALPLLDRLICALEDYRSYMIRQVALGVPLGSMTRHTLGLFQGLPGAKSFRRDLSDHHALRNQGIGWFDASLTRFLTVQRTAAT